MKRFVVSVDYEFHDTIEVEATNEEEAVNKALAEGDWLHDFYQAETEILDEEELENA